MSARTVLLTGASGFIGKHLLRRYLDEPETELYLLQRAASRKRLDDFLERDLDDARRAKVHVVEGNIAQPDLGLEPATRDSLAHSATHIIHAAAVYDLQMTRAVGMRVNMGGTRHVLDFAKQCRALERLAYFSTIAVSGLFEGVYTEDDCDVGQSFKNHYDETKFLAERLVRERADALPITILRPTVVVGDTETGAFEKIDGPYHALVMIARNMHLVVQNAGNAKCHMAPVDFIADAAHALTHDPETRGGTYHLGDPNPMTYNAFYDAVCERWGKIKPLLKLPPAMIKPMFYLPGFAHLTGVSYEAFQYSYHRVEYDMSRAQEALARHGIACPPVSSYLDAFLAYFKAHYRDPDIRK
ncbi:MAG TPA: NAD-dependent epimerase/dehydratase family protein [Candidatus Hydrogenedentes bacterium]|nr:NAD-dependent epimerase/dehydratase family protein [Candidatus Hydrogenedentota bacterium]